MSEPRIPGGGFIIARRIIESEIMDKPPLYMKVWIYLLSRAQYTDYKGLKRGQLITSVPEIREACSWKVGARKVTPTEKEVRSVLDWMRGKSRSVESKDERTLNGVTNGAMISTAKVTHGLLVTIENYDVYQSFDNYERRTEKGNERRNEKASNGVRGAEYKKESYKKEIITDDDIFAPVDFEESAKGDERIERIKTAFSKKALKIYYSPMEEKAMSDLLDAGIPVETILEGIERTFQRFKPKYPGHKITSFNYCVGPIKELHASKQKGEASGYEIGTVQYGGNQTTYSNDEVVDGYYSQFDGLFYSN